MSRFSFLIKVLLICLCSTSTFVPVNAQELYKLVTSASELKAGCKYIFASMANGDGNVMKSYINGDNNCKAQSATSVNDLITYKQGFAQLELVSAGTNVWAFKDVSTQKYMTVTKSAGNCLMFLSTSIDKYSKFNISFSQDKKAKVSCTTEKDNYNYIVGFFRALCSSYQNQKDLYLYKEYNPAEALSSISFSGSLKKTQYLDGDAPSIEGLKVIAKFNDNTEQDVTTAATFSYSASSLKLFDSELTITATFANKTISQTFPIRVSSKCDFTLPLHYRSYEYANKVEVKWSTSVSDILLETHLSSTAADYFTDKLIDDQNDSRVASGQRLTITPNVNIYKIEILAIEHDAYFKVFKALSQDKIQNATFEIRNHETQNDHKYIDFFIVNEEKPITMIFTSSMAWKKITFYYRPLSTTIGQAGYSTLCLPYAAKVPDGIKVYAAKDDGQKVTLIERGDGKIAGNEGVVLQGKAGHYEFFAAATKAEKIATNEMMGVVKDTQLTSADNAYLLTRRKSDGQVAFRLLQTNYTLGANKAYLKSKVQDSNRVLLSVYDAVETGIDAIEDEENQAVKNGAIYNLSGQRMSRMHKGINIVNGKLVIR